MLSLSIIPSPSLIFNKINCSVFILLSQFHLLVNFLWQFQLLVHDLQPLSLLYSPHIHFTHIICCKRNNNTNTNNNNDNNNNLQDLQPPDVCGMGIAGSAAKLMACALLNDCTVCPAQENETAALSSNILHFSRNKSICKEMNELDYSLKMAGSNEQFFISITFIAGLYAGSYVLLD